MQKTEGIPGANTKLFNERTIYRGVNRTKEMRSVEASGDKQEGEIVNSLRLEGAQGVLEAGKSSSLEGEPDQSRRHGRPSPQIREEYPSLSLLPSANLPLLLPTDLNQPETRG